MFRKFLEWLYLFDFIEGDLAHAIFYYLHPESFIKMIEEGVSMKGLVEGRIVHYVLTEEDANQINVTRLASQLARQKVQTENTVILHTGNPVMAYEHFPAVITRVFHNEFGEGKPGVNLQVFLDGNDSHWVCSRKFAEPADLQPGTWHWIEPA